MLYREAVAEQHAVIDLLATLGHAVNASFVRVERRFGPEESLLVWARSDDATDPVERGRLARLVQEHLAAEDAAGPEPPVVTVASAPWHIAATSLHGSSLEGDTLVAHAVGESPSRAAIST